MSTKQPTRYRSYSAVICLIAMLWNIPSVQATEALEILRPRAAEGHLAVRVDEDKDGSNSEETAYIITFKNLSDHEVAYDGLTFKFPDLDVQPTLLTPEEADQYRRDRELTKPPADGQTSSTYTPVHFPYIHSSSGAGSCKEACVIFAVIFVVIIVGAIALAIADSNRKEKARLSEQAMLAKRLTPNPEGPIRLLRYQETTRQVILRKDPRQPIKTMVIEVIDKNQEKRSFKALLVEPDAT